MKTIVFILGIIIVMFAYQYKHKSAEVEFTKVEQKVVVTATMYMPTKGQCDSDPLVTACGKRINPKRASQHKWIAVSRDLLKIFKYGDVVQLSNAGVKDGIYTIADTMNKRFKNKIDILESEGTKKYKLNNVIINKVRHETL